MASVLRHEHDAWMSRRDALALISRQDGLINRNQAISHGLSDADLRRLVRRHEWARVHPGAFVNHTGPPGWRQRAWAGVLYAYPAALCAQSASRADPAPPPRLSHRGPGGRERGGVLCPRAPLPDLRRAGPRAAIGAAADPRLEPRADLPRCALRTAGVRRGARRTTRPHAGSRPRSRPGQRSRCCPRRTADCAARMGPGGWSPVSHGHQAGAAAPAKRVAGQSPAVQELCWRRPAW